MASAWGAFLLLVITFSTLSMARVEAQSGAVIVSTDLQILSIGSLDGGGHVKWTATASQAVALREKVLRMFDAQQFIPTGFVYQGLPTGATTATVNNSQIDPEEAGRFLDYLENEIEGIPYGYSGTDFRFTLIKAADRIERGLPADRSSRGLVGTRTGDLSNIEISFVFEIVDSTVPTDVFPQADVAFARALHHVFTLDGRDDLQDPCEPFCYPFPVRDGWRVVGPAPPTVPYTGRFLWFGEPTASPWFVTGSYSEGISNHTWYSTNGVNAARVDLRYASRGTFSFNYSGGVVGGNDGLLVQTSTDGASWTNLTEASDTGLPFLDAVPIDTLATATFDLPVTDQQIYLRLNFTSDSDGVRGGPGYFLRDFRIHAPSEYQGEVDLRHVDYVVGFLSFQDFVSPGAKPQLIRTPVGEVLYYSNVYPWNATPADSARYATFDVIENPQILFVLLLVSAWLLGYFRDRSYNTYRLKHPASLRTTATKIKWLVWTDRIIILFLVIVYFFPTVLIGTGIVFSGAVLWGISLGFTGGMTVLTTFLYQRRAASIPPEPEIGPGEIPSNEILPPPPPGVAEVQSRLICAHCEQDIGDFADAYKCACGQVYLKAHAIDLRSCPNCGRGLEVEKPTEKRMVTVKCPSCGEIDIVEEGISLAFVKCGNCGVVLQEIQVGYNYLLFTEEPHVAYEWFKSVVKRGVPGLVMSTTFPEKLKREYGLPDGVELYWMSDTSPGARTLDPKRLDFEIMRALSNFVKNNKGGALVLDGLEYLIVENSFDRVLKFIKKVNDLASVHDATMFVPVTTTGLGPEEATVLRKEFDKVETVQGKG